MDLFGPMCISTPTPSTCPPHRSTRRAVCSPPRRRHWAAPSSVAGAVRSRAGARADRPVLGHAPQWVPTMFVRMLAAGGRRASYDVSSLQVAIHAAAVPGREVK
ncbi:hypothetical protein HBB16_21895 [Pseudonocardia sp. MCCB 268]|nr:hypothetical protein [Pseudonocardia cytotoxica]